MSIQVRRIGANGREYLYRLQYVRDGDRASLGERINQVPVNCESRHTCPVPVMISCTPYGVVSMHVSIGQHRLNQRMPSVDTRIENADSWAVLPWPFCASKKLLDPLRLLYFCNPVEKICRFLCFP